MAYNNLKRKLAAKHGFIIYVELTGGPSFNFGPIDRFFSAYKEADILVIPDSFDFVGKSIIPEDFDFLGITLQQNTGGWANIKPADVFNQLKLMDLLVDLDVMPHVSCKDHNTFGIVSILAGYRNVGIESILVMTGDKPVEAKGVFEMDSIGLQNLIGDMNKESYLRARPNELDIVHQFYLSAVVSPFKCTQRSLMLQY